MIRTLIIDDDKLARKGLISIVPWKECGMEVVGEAANGQKALEFLEEQPVDFAVVDLAMPVMTGLQFIEASRKKWPHLQYVVLSFYEDFKNVQAALRLGTLDYISKMQLDQQDCTEVFRRVGEIIRAQGCARPVSPETAVPDTSLEKQWLSLYWFYSAAQFHSLVKSTLEEAFPPRLFEHMMVQISDALRQQFGFHVPSIPVFPDISAGMSFAQLRRRELLQFILAEKNHPQLEAGILRICAVLQKQPGEPFTMEGAAKQANLSRSYFAAAFKRCTGVTFNQYLRRERVFEAQRLMQEKDVPACDVGQLVGYKDAKYFIQIFQQQTGMTPQAFQENGALACGNPETPSNFTRENKVP